VVTARATATFEPVGRSVASARGFVRDTLQGWGFSEVVDDAVVLVSELVTNAVVHAGTSAEVVCLRDDDGIRVEVADRYPKRMVPLYDGAYLESPVDHLFDSGRTDPHRADLEREGGRGLLLCAALASCWGVDYAPAHKRIWFRLDLPARAAGTRFAGPVTPDGLLPAADSTVRVAVVQVDGSGLVLSWNPDAEVLFGLDPVLVVGKPLGAVAAWPQTPGTGFGLDEALRLSRWEGSYGMRCGDGRTMPVYGTHLRIRDSRGAASTVCLLVRDAERAVLQSPFRTQNADGAAAGAHPDSGIGGPQTFDAFIGSPAPDDLDGLLQRTVERARDMLDGDAAYLLLATDDETELEVRASCGLPAGRQRFSRVPVEAGSGRYGSARLPAVHDDLTAQPGSVPLLGGTGLRSLVTVPLKVEGRLTGSLGVAAQAADQYRNEDALRLQFAPSTRSPSSRRPNWRSCCTRTRTRSTDCGRCCSGSRRPNR